MNFTKNELRNIILEELQEIEELDEGILDRIRSQWAGAKAQGGAYWKNFQRAAKPYMPQLTGEPDSGDPDPDADAGPIHAKRAGTKAMVLKKMELVQKKLTKTYEDFKNDIEKLGIAERDPEIAKMVNQMRGRIGQAASIANSISEKVSALTEE